MPIFFVQIWSFNTVNFVKTLKYDGLSPAIAEFNPTFGEIMAR